MGRHGDPAATSATCRDLDLLFAQLAELRELASDPAASTDRARIYDLSIRWGTYLAGRLHRLEHYADLGELAPGERERYECLLGELREALPDVDRLGLARPIVARWSR